jgi:sugar/nucleoside kinase (ribokinase family)
VTDGVRRALAELAEEDPEKVVVVDSRSSILEFDNVVVKPNHIEACRCFDPALQLSDIDEEVICQSGSRLNEKTGRAAFVTAGAQGAYIFDNGHAMIVPSVRVEGPIDIVGAGDTYISALTSALVCDASNAEAAAFAHIASSISLRKLQETGSATKEEVLDAYERLP